MNPTVNGIYIVCGNIRFDTVFVLLDDSSDYVQWTVKNSTPPAPLYRGIWCNMPDAYGRREVKKFLLEPDHSVVYMWIGQ